MRKGYYKTAIFKRNPVSWHVIEKEVHMEAILLTLDSEQLFTGEWLSSRQLEVSEYVNSNGILRGYVDQIHYLLGVRFKKLKRFMMLFTVLRFPLPKSL